MNTTAAPVLTIHKCSTIVKGVGAGYAFAIWQAGNNFDAIARGFDRVSLADDAYDFSPLRGA